MMIMAQSLHEKRRLGWRVDERAGVMSLPQIEHFGGDMVSQRVVFIALDTLHEEALGEDRRRARIKSRM